MDVNLCVFRMSSRKNNAKVQSFFDICKYFKRKNGSFFEEPFFLTYKSISYLVFM